MTAKPFSQACENNREPIAEVLQRYIHSPGTLLEIGSGTGQHAAYLSRLFPNVIWQPSDRSMNLSGITTWVEEAQCATLHAPEPLDVDEPLPVWLVNAYPTGFEYLFTANTLHIMSWPTVERLFALLPSLLKLEAQMFIYGPFKEKGQYTSESNERFDQLLASSAPHQGIRDLEAVVELAAQYRIHLVENQTMPANNQLLVWRYH